MASLQSELDACMEMLNQAVQLQQKEQVGIPVSPPHVRHPFVKDILGSRNNFTGTTYALASHMNFSDCCDTPSCPAMNMEGILF